jgi:anti-anti-sigma factor
MDDNAESELLEITVTRDAASADVVLTGELDPHTAPLLERQLRELLGDEQVTEVALDLGGVRFIDSSGLRVVLGAQQVLEERAGRFVLRSPTPTTSRLLEITGLTERLEVE